MSFTHNTHSYALRNRVFAVAKAVLEAFQVDGTVSVWHHTPFSLTSVGYTSQFSLLVLSLLLRGAGLSFMKL